MGGEQSVTSKPDGLSEEGKKGSQCTHCGHEQSTVQNALEKDTEVVVIPVDAGKDSLRAFKWYVENIHRPGHRVHILHCCEIEYPSGKHFPDYAVPPEQWEDKVASCESLSYQILRHYEEQMKKEQIAGTVSTKLGRPGKTVIETAQEVNASMIVMGSRGLTPLAKTVLGSVSEYVVQKSKVPVTIVPPPEKLDLLWYLLH